MISDDHRSRNCRKSMQGRFLMTFEYVVNVDVGLSHYVQTGHSEKPPQAQAGLVKFNTRCSTENCGSNGSGSKYDDSSNPKRIENDLENRSFRSGCHDKPLLHDCWIIYFPRDFSWDPQLAHGPRPSPSCAGPGSKGDTHINSAFLWGASHPPMANMQRFSGQRIVPKHRGCWDIKS